MLPDGLVNVVNEYRHIRHFVLPLCVVTLELIFQRAAREVERELTDLILIEILNDLIILSLS